MDYCIQTPLCKNKVCHIYKVPDFLQKIPELPGCGCRIYNLLIMFTFMLLGSSMFETTPGPPFKKEHFLV